ncbi:MAG: hypothetical protein KKD69_06480 [Euryarchaeota archaeon]|nr:hypothetical protein [Euryarchaeota archaeon]
MKKIIYLLFTVILSLSSASCTDKDKSSNERSLDKLRSETLMKIILNGGEKESDEFITLLAIKYGLSAGLTGRIIKEFGRDESLLFKNFLKAKTLKDYEKINAEHGNRPGVLERIKRISDNNEIDQPKIAALLIDYKIWQEARTDTGQGEEYWPDFDGERY